MTAMDPCLLGDALRASAGGIHPLEAGTGLLIECGSWLHRDDFASRFITADLGASLQWSGTRSKWLDPTTLRWTR
jgi:hypothetical protein